MTDASVFAIDFTSEGMNAAFVTPDGREEALAGFDLIDFQAGEGKALDKLVTLLAAKARTGGPVSAVALSLPCDLDAGRTRVVSFPQATWLNGQPLPSILEDALGVPAVMERRAVVLLHYDRAMLGLPEDCLAVGCYIDTHYDTAIWHNGRALLGKNGGAGNIAHMVIPDREDVCFCGRTGCVDLYGAGVRLRQLHTMIFPDTPREELFTHHGEHPIILDFLRMMAYPIAIELNILDPDFVILGGSILSMPGFPLKTLQEEIIHHAYRPEPDRGTAFLPSAANMAPGVVCAAQYAMTKLGRI